VYSGDDLKPGMTLQGPAIIEEPTTTLVVYPTMAVSVTGAGNYRLQLSADETIQSTKG